MKNRHKQILCIFIIFIIINILLTLLLSIYKKQERRKNTEDYEIVIEKDIPKESEHFWINISSGMGGVTSYIFVIMPDRNLEVFFTEGTGIEIANINKNKHPSLWEYKKVKTKTKLSEEAFLVLTEIIDKILIEGDPYDDVNHRSGRDIFIQFGDKYKSLMLYGYPLDWVEEYSDMDGLLIPQLIYNLIKVSPIELDLS